MATLTEDDVLEQLDAQDNLFSFMKNCAYHFAPGDTPVSAVAVCR